MTQTRHTWLLVAALLGVPWVASASRPVRPTTAPPPDAPVDAGPPTPEPAPDTTPAPAPTPSSPSPGRPVTPVGAPASTPPPPKPREIPAELTAKPIELKKIENPAEVRYQQRAGDFYFRLHVRPGNPKPGDELDLILEVAEVRDPPDPVLGDRVPVQNEELVATFGKSSALRELHPLASAGEFGLHVTAEESGVQSLAIHRRTDKPGLAATFPIGVGVPTPGRPDDMVASAEAKPLPTIAGVRPDAKPGDLGDVMRQLGQQDLALAMALERPKGDTAAAAKALSDLSARVAGLVPAPHADRVREFDQVAGASASLAADVAHTTDREKLKAKLGTLEQNGCLRCHAQFWYGVADDTSAWPTFTPAAGGRP